MRLAVARTRLVMLVATSPCFLFPGSQAHDAEHHAGMDRKDSCCGMYKAGYAGCDATRAVFVSLVRTRSASWKVWSRRTVTVACARLVFLVKLWRFRSCSSVQVVDFPFVPQRQLSMVPPCRKTIEISQLQYSVIDVPVMQVEQVHFHVVTQRPIPWTSLSGRPLRFAIAVRAGWSMFLLCGSSKFREACSRWAGRALCTGTGPGFDNRHQGGEGVAGTPGACSRAFCLPS